MSAGRLFAAFARYAGSRWKSVENECIRRAPSSVMTMVSANTRRRRYSFTAPVIAAT